MKKMTPETIEKDRIKDYLDLKGYFHFPLLQGLACYKGLPDRIAIKGGKVIAIEIKSATGHQSECQRQFQTDWENAGGTYFIGGLDKLIELIG